MIPATANASAATERATPRHEPSGVLGFREYAVLVAVGAFVTTFAQSRVLGQFPVTFLLKEHFNLQREDVALFFYWVTFPWNLKPLVGILIDGFPLFGTRRRHYMLLGAALSAVTWLGVGLFANAYRPLLYASLVMNIALVVASTVMGGLMVEAGHRFGASGRMSSLRQFVMNVSYILGPALGGFLAGRAFGWTAAIAVASCIALTVCTFLVLREPRSPQPRPLTTEVMGVEREPVPRAMVIALAGLVVLATALLQIEALRSISFSLYGLAAAFAVIIGLAVVPTSNPVVINAQQQLGQIFRSRSLWFALVMMLLFYTAPGFQTALVYQQSDVLKFGKSFIGLLGSIEGVFGVAAAAAYVFICRAFNLRGLLIGGIVVNALAVCTYLIYSAQTAPVAHAMYGGSGGFALILVELAMMDLAIRSTPRGCEALGFALLMSARNVGIAMSDVFGAQMMDQYHVSFNTLVMVNATTTLLMIAFVPFLPAAIVGAREGRR